MADKERTLLMIGNAHIDPVWLWRWDEGFAEVYATFRSALDRLAEYDDFVFTASSAAFYEWIEKGDPAMFAEIRQRVAEGRWHVAGGWWIEPDCNLPGGESFVRQGLYGQRYFREHLGVTATVGYCPDSFGHHGMLPQILRKSGMSAYVFMRPMAHEKGLPGDLFQWEADDGSRVLGIRIPYEYCSWPADIEKHVRRVAATLKEPQREAVCFYGVGNHGGGPTRQNIECIHRLAEDPELPALVCAAPSRLVNDLDGAGTALPVVHEDLQHHASGCYAAHSGIKRLNRQAENALLAAEKWAAVAQWVTGQPYPAAELTQAWKNVLFNQFHDVLAGTSVEPAYADAAHTYGEALAIAGRSLNYAVQSLAWRIQIPYVEAERPLVVFNPHAWAARVPVEAEFGRLPDEDGLIDERGQNVPCQRVQPLAAANGRTRLAFTAELPPLGYRVYRVAPPAGPDQPGAEPAVETAPAAQPTPLPAGENWIEGGRFRLEINPETGAIARLFDRQAQVQAFWGEGARAVVLDDPSDTWSHNVFRYDRVAGAFGEPCITLAEHGAVKNVLRVASTYRHSTLVQEFTLYADLDQVDVRVTIDWREQCQVLKLRFPINVAYPKNTCEIPYGRRQRFANGDEEPGQGWVDISGESRDNGVSYGVSILNDGKPSFDINVRDIGLTVLRSPAYANHMPFVCEPGSNYAYLDQGVQQFNYTILPHEGSWEQAGTVRRAAELNQRPTLIPATFHPDGSLPQSDSFLSVDAGNVIVSVVKQAEDGAEPGAEPGAEHGGDLVLRAYETDGCATDARICLPHWGRTITAGFGPYEIKTWRVPRNPGQPAVETNLLEWIE